MFNIGNKLVGKDDSIFIIAEAGVNHNGDINIAQKLIDEAVKVGADAIKFQTFITEKLVTDYASMANYQKNNLNISDSQFNMLKDLELSFDDFYKLERYCNSKGILFLSTPFDKESADFLESINIEAFKIGSGDLTNIPLIKHIARFNKPIILSSGMSDLGDIEDALRPINNSGNKKVAVLHCTSNYPADLKSVNLKAMLTIRDSFNVLCGYSDHTEGITIPIAAAALGANIIEKHFTLDKSMKGPDHKASLEPSDFKKMIDGVRAVEAALGTGVKNYTLSEKDTISVARKSIVAAKNISKGEIITEEMLDYKRPGNGLSPKYYQEVIGKKARMSIKTDEQIRFNILE